MHPGPREPARAPGGRRDEVPQDEQGTFRERAAADEFPRYGHRSVFRYYVYDLLDYTLGDM